MTLQSIKELLCEQMELLAEQSREAKTNNDVKTMIAINARICETINVMKKIFD